jgi:CyaY protein
LAWFYLVSGAGIMVFLPSALYKTPVVGVTRKSIGADVTGLSPSFGTPFIGVRFTINEPRTPQAAHTSTMRLKMKWFFTVRIMTSRIYLSQTNNQNDFLLRAQAVLTQLEITLEQTFEDLGLDVDLERNGGVLNVNLAGKAIQGKTVVINLQSPMQQLWLATPFGGFHYAWNGSDWEDTRGGLTLPERLSHDLSTMTGASITLSV